MDGSFSVGAGDVVILRPRIIVSETPLALSSQNIPLLFAANNSHINQLITMVSIIIGILMIAGGLSGKLVLAGTNSGVALALLGAGLVAWGVFKILRARQS